jgi:hypothetical protein
MTYPTFDEAETDRRLCESIDTVIGAARMVPVAYTHALMPGLPDYAWTVAMNLAHLVVYEEGIAVPILESLASGADGRTLIRADNEGWFYNDAVALSSEPVAILVTRLQAARSRQVEIVRSFSPVDWNRRWSPAFSSGLHGNGPHSPAWIATKSFQHTWEHGNAVLRAALFAPRPD